MTLYSSFRNCLKSFLLLGALLFFSTAKMDADPPGTDWPEIEKESRPWTYWWWLGSAVTPEELTRHLTEYHSLGMGGVHIIPIYGAKGYEDRMDADASAHYFRSGAARYGSRYDSRDGLAVRRPVGRLGGRRREGAVRRVFARERYIAK